MKPRGERRSRWLAMVLAAAVAAPVAALAESPGPHFFPFNAPADPQAPRISGLDVTPVQRIVPGVVLRFRLLGTPGAHASLRIDGAQRVLALTEVAPGHYRGNYTVGRQDRIAPDAAVVGNLRRGDQLGLALLTEPLQRGAHRVGAPA